MRFFKKKTTPPQDDIPAPKPATVTRLGPSFRLKGHMSGSDDVIFEGRLEGNIQIQGHLTLPDTAAVTGDMSAQTIDMAGKAEGGLTAEKKIVLRRSTRIKGHLGAPALSLQAGAVFDGKISMGESFANRPFDLKRTGGHGK